MNAGRYLPEANPNVIHLTEFNENKMSRYWLSRNPAIFAYDHELISKTNDDKNRCVAEWFGHPRFIQKYIDEYGMEALDDYMA